MSDPNLDRAANQIRAANAVEKLAIKSFFDEATNTASYVIPAR